MNPSDSSASTVCRGDNIMSPDQDPSREDRYALLTAYALGMVTPE